MIEAFFHPIDLGAAQQLLQNLFADKAFVRIRPLVANNVWLKTFLGMSPQYDIPSKWSTQIVK